MRFFKPHISLIYNTGEIFYHNISYIKVFLSCPHLSGMRFMFPDNVHLGKKTGAVVGPVRSYPPQNKLKVEKPSSGD